MKKAVLCLLALAVLGAWAQNTTRRSLATRHSKRTEDVRIAPAVVQDTIVSGMDAMVSLSGYDKPLNSRHETFFLSNRSARGIEGLVLTLSYYDVQGRLLHRKTRNIKTAVPGGETRQVSVSSWDRQFSFYYMKSAVPKHHKTAVPYTVQASVDTLFLTPASFPLLPESEK